MLWHSSWIALHAGVAATADAILIPEIPFDIDKVAEKVRERDRGGRHFSIIVAAEGAKAKGGDYSFVAEKTPGRMERLGGIGQRVCTGLESITGKEARAVT